MNKWAIAKYIAVILAVINLIWLFAFNYRIPGRSNKSSKPEYNIAETASMAEADEAAPEEEAEEPEEPEAAENPAQAGTEADPAAGKTRRCRVVQGTGLNVRSGPGSDYEVVTTVTGGTEMECLDEGEGTWLHVKTLDGKEGYVSKGYVEMLED